MFRKNRRVVALAVLVGITLLSGCAVAEPRPSATPTGAPTAAGDLPQGTRGAAHFDDLALVLGDGPVDVQVWIDPFCPDCKAFEEASGADIEKLIAAHDITYSIHLMNFLDRASQGSAYSTRAGSALVCVAVEQPDRLLAGVQALYAAQPVENTTGLTDAAIVDVLADAGIADLGGCVDEAPYAAWVQSSNDHAIAGIEGADVPKISGTPTLIVDGVSYTGDIADAAGIRAFLTSGGS